MNPFPFSAIVGLEPAKQSLIYHFLDPRLGGTLLLGHRGCAKSTLVRSFAALLTTSTGAPAPFADVPLGVTEDRLLGSIDAASLVTDRTWRSQAGLLEQAHEGILYIDEINLLPDHLSDLLLDSAASGVHRLERDGISRTVDSRYILIGTMNPEEGELRPQLLDRFAHGVRIQDDFSESDRVAIVARRLDFDDDPRAFLQQWDAADHALRQRLQRARSRVARIAIPDELRQKVAREGKDRRIEGLRTELAVLRTARCAAAWRDSGEVAAPDLEEAWSLCLGHRTPPVLSTDSSVPPPERPSARTSSTQSGARSPSQTRSERVPISREGPPANPPALAPDSPHRLRDLGTFNGPTKLFSHSSGPISWMASLLKSVRVGWLGGTGTWQISRADRPLPATLWLLIDASRSTGMSRFLGKTLALLQASSVPTRTRFHTLLLHDHRISWLTWNRPWIELQRRLSELPGAAGGSHLAPALTRLTRAVLRRPGSPTQVALFTDGLNQRLPGETSDQSQGRLVSALRRLQSLTHGLAWYSPGPSLGIPHWPSKIWPHPECQHRRL